ncbi:MAG: trehalose-phosphatase [Burkholderiales bacterium]|nr:trehalose-phosphatase [Burkholderiales bacterium]
MNFVDILCPSCALFLDFDGTLVDIAAQPEAVQVSPTLISTLSKLQDYMGGALALISGRPIAQVDAFLHPLLLPAAGVHGTERRNAGGEMQLLTTHSLENVERAAARLVAQHPALRLENKRGSIALHYRQAPELEALCLEAMQAAVDESPGLTLLHGKMVVEAKPGGASKGRAIEAFLREPPFAGHTPVFVGDDVTDEVGFSTVQRLGGMGIKVGEGPSVAWQRVASPQALRLELETAMATRAARAAG